MNFVRRSGLVVLGFLLLAGLPGSGSRSAAAAAMDTIAKQAILIDMNTGTVLFEKNADERMPTSSMSKIMTAFMVFEAIEQGRLSLDDTLPVSERAWRMQGSKMFTELGNNIRVEDLIRGVIVQSGNDASVVLAEGLAGTEEAFAERMNARAQELGLKDSHFMNATGWPHEDHYSTARDLAHLAEAVIRRFPQFYHFYSEIEFTYHDIKQGNRNPLLYRNMGVDGLKTGHTEAAGYGLAASAERDGRRLVLVVNGLPSMQARADESAHLIEWGFREFDAYPLFKKGETVESAAVWFGTEDTVPVTVNEDLSVTMSRKEHDGLKVTARLQEPVEAPVAAGTEIGTLVIEGPGFSTREVPLLAAVDVPRLGFVGRIGAAAKQMLINVVN